MPFAKAVKRDANLRFAISGPAGSGKTFTLLRVAKELGGKVAFVDTEHGSASKYAHTPACSVDCADPSHFDFDVIEPSSFDPRDLMAYIAEAVKNGYRSICCDSLSHYWMGPDGELELVDTVAKSQRGNSFAAWKSVTPIHNKLVDMILSAPIHVLVTMRTKTEWVVEKNSEGKMVPRKVGLAPIMRGGIEFEFDVCGDIDQDNTLSITKTRCSALTGKSYNRPGPEIAALLKEWLGSPAAASSPSTPASAEEVLHGNMVATAPPVPVTPLAELHPAVKYIVEGILDGRKGAAGEGLRLMRQRLMELLPETGEAEYQRILAEHGFKLHGFREAGGAKLCADSIVEMHKIILATQDAQPGLFVASDDDLPVFAPPVESK